MTANVARLASGVCAAALMMVVAAAHSSAQIYGNSSQIVQGPGYVAITYEMIHDTRIIPLAAGPHLGKDIRTDFGDSRGHWEGDTLVVETTNSSDAARTATPIPIA